MPLRRNAVSPHCVPTAPLPFCLIALFIAVVIPPLDRRYACPFPFSLTIHFALQSADVYMYDEPSSYLDVRQRLKAAHVIRSLAVKEVDATPPGVDDDAAPAAAADAAAAPAPAAAGAGAAAGGAGAAAPAAAAAGKGAGKGGHKTPGGSSAGGAGGSAVGPTAGVAKDRYVICVEHDLAVLDYLSDFICVLYGTPGASPVPGPSSGPACAVWTVRAVCCRVAAQCPLDAFLPCPQRKSSFAAVCPGAVCPIAVAGIVSLS